MTTPSKRDRGGSVVCRFESHAVCREPRHIAAVEIGSRSASGRDRGLRIRCRPTPSAIRTHANDGTCVGRTRRANGRDGRANGHRPGGAKPTARGCASTSIAHLPGCGRRGTAPRAARSARRTARMRSTASPRTVNLDRCFYLAIDEFEHRAFAYLRLAPARNGQLVGVKMAVDHPLGAVAQLGERSAGSRKVRGSSPLSSTSPPPPVSRPAGGG